MDAPLFRQGVAGTDPVARSWASSRRLRPQGRQALRAERAASQRADSSLDGPLMRDLRQRDAALSVIFTVNLLVFQAASVAVTTALAFSVPRLASWRRADLLSFSVSLTLPPPVRLAVWPAMVVRPSLSATPTLQLVSLAG